MTIPSRGSSEHGTYFITASTFMKTHLLQSQRSASLFIDVLYHYRAEGKFFLHEFVAMPDHFHLLITPAPDLTLERCMQLIKGGFSFRRKRELGLGGGVWQTSFYDHRVRNHDEYEGFRKYIWENPVRKGLAPRPEDFPFSSAHPGYTLDDPPQRLKPPAVAAL